MSKLPKSVTNYIQKAQKSLNKTGLVVAAKSPGAADGPTTRLVGKLLGEAEPHHLHLAPPLLTGNDVQPMLGMPTPFSDAFAIQYSINPDDTEEACPHRIILAIQTTPEKLVKQLSHAHHDPAILFGFTGVESLMLFISLGYHTKTKSWSFIAKAVAIPDNHQKIDYPLLEKHGITAQKLDYRGLALDSVLIPLLPTTIRVAQKISPNNPILSGPAVFGAYMALDYMQLVACNNVELKEIKAKGMGIKNLGPSKSRPLLTPVITNGTSIDPVARGMVQITGKTASWINERH